MRTTLPLPLVVALLSLVLVSSPVSAHIGGAPGSGQPWEQPAPSEDFIYPRGEPPCPNDNPGWRNTTMALNVSMLPDPHCEPDNPQLVAALVKGTNNVPQEVLDKNALHQDAVVKGPDLDGDGDPDVINITLEVHELNGWHLSEDDLAEFFSIAPGIHPGLWVFAPKVTIDHTGPRYFDLARMPSIPLRVEQGDTVNLRLENTHYFPHTIHLHGVDHPFEDAQGEGNDGVPRISETPVLPGQARTYTFTARQVGSMWYHCHVQPDKHVMMGLGSSITIVEDREDNWVQTMNPGGGLVRHPDKASQERFDREYDLIYQDLDKTLAESVQESNDPRVIAKFQNRQYDSTDRASDYFLLNGRAFPYTLRESMVIVEPDEDILLRVLNAGEDTISLHTHGHKATIAARDGVPDPAPVQRDVYTLSAAQRLDLVLNTTDDGLNAYSQGIWFMHDHIEKHITTDGHGPGGDISLITYASFLNETTAMPEINGGPLRMWFNEEFYRGELPVWGDLGQNDILGEITNGSQPADDEQPVPASGALGLLAGALAAAALALRRREVRP